MKLHKSIALSSVFAVGVLGAANVLAAPNFYLKGYLGTTDFAADLDVDVDDWGYNEIDGDDISVGIAGGISFNRYIAIELGYMNYGEVSEKYTGGEFSYGPYEEYYDGKVSGTVDALLFSAIVSIPLSENFSLYGRAGIANWYAELDDTYTYIETYNGSVSYIDSDTIASKAMMSV